MRGRRWKACTLRCVTRKLCAFGLFLALNACQKAESRANKATPSSASVTPAVSAPATAASSLASAASAPAASAPVPAAPAVTFTPDPARYAWLDGERPFPKPEATLEQRFPTPPGYSRVAVEPGSFAEWLRSLPLAAEGTPVTTFDGKESLAGDDDYLAGVIAIDTGNADLQQSSDVIIRLQAEYLWSKGEKARISYSSATKLNMPLSRWEKGQRLLPNGPNVFWVIKEAQPSELTYAEFRRYLDAVFNWANSTALAARSTVVSDPKELVPGDFFLQSRAPNHVAIVLDLAEKPSGERVALLGQARNPAESVHVVRPGKATPWFSVRPPVPVLTPHSQALAWDDLRRLPPAEPEK